MSPPASHYCLYETKFIVRMHDDEKPRPLWNRTLNLLCLHGWSITNDPTVKHLKSLRSSHQVGIRTVMCRNTDGSPRPITLHFCTSVHERFDGKPGGSFEIEFWQEEVNEKGRTNSARYAFGKLKLMPFLHRMMWLAERNRLTAFWQKSGLIPDPEQKPDYPYKLPAFEQLHLHMKTWRWHVQKYDPATHTPNSRGSSYDLDRDKQPLTPGARRCVYDYRGHLCIGHVYYQMNNNWFLLVNDRTPILCRSSYEFFTWQPGTPRRKPLPPKEQKERIQSCLKKAEAAQNYERCIRYRDAIKKLAA